MFSALCGIFSGRHAPAAVGQRQQEAASSILNSLRGPPGLPCTLHLSCRSVPLLQASQPKERMARSAQQQAVQADGSIAHHFI
jgi:hypothetical protein